MTIGDIEKLQKALEFYDKVSDEKDKFIAEQTNDGEDEPEDYARYDEKITDFNYELAWRAEFLAAAIREVIG